MGVLKRNLDCYCMEYTDSEETNVFSGVTFFEELYNSWSAGKAAYIDEKIVLADGVVFILKEVMKSGERYQLVFSRLENFNVPETLIEKSIKKIEIGGKDYIITNNIHMVVFPRDGICFYQSGNNGVPLKKISDFLAQKFNEFNATEDFTLKFQMIVKTGMERATRIKSLKKIFFKGTYNRSLGFIGGGENKEGINYDFEIRLKARKGYSIEGAEALLDELYNDFDAGEGTFMYEYTDDASMSRGFSKVLVSETIMRFEYEEDCAVGNIINSTNLFDAVRSIYSANRITILKQANITT